LATVTIDGLTAIADVYRPYRAKLFNFM